MQNVAAITALLLVSSLLLSSPLVAAAPESSAKEPAPGPMNKETSGSADEPAPSPADESSADPLIASGFSKPVRINHHKLTRPDNRPICKATSYNGHRVLGLVPICQASHLPSCFLITLHYLFCAYLNTTTCLRGMHLSK